MTYPSRTAWKPLILPTFDSSCGPASLEHGLQFDPAAPVNQPAGVVVVLAILVSAEAGQGEVR
jgi:hypothetical protein